MNNISGPSQSYQSLTPSYTPLGKPAAGLESPENKDQTLPPVEEANASEKNRNQPNQKADAVSSDDGERADSEQKAEQTAELTDAEQQQVRELAATDRAVRAHEAAHQAVGGNLAGAASFRFVIGPDGARYAVGGEVPVVLAAVADDPEATLRNAEQVRAAALAPAQPSDQDRQVAARAAQMITQAQVEIALQRVATLQEERTGASANGTSASAAVDSFTANSNQTLPPGSLLDQRS